MTGRIINPGDGAARFAAVLQDIQRRLRNLESSPRVPQLSLLGGAQQDFIDDLENTTSITYTDLATVGPRINVELVSPNGRLLVWLASTISTDGDQGGRMSFEVDGPTALPAHDDRSVFGSAFGRYGDLFLVDALEPGSYTLTAKYRTDFISPATSRYQQRRLIVFSF